MCSGPSDVERGRETPNNQLAWTAGQRRFAPLLRPLNRSVMRHGRDIAVARGIADVADSRCCNGQPVNYGLLPGASLPHTGT